MRTSKPFAMLLTVTMLTACAEQGGPLTREGVGTAAGAVAGGVLGSTIGGGAGKTVAVVGGALLGGLLGNMAGKQMDQESVTAYDSASQRALNTGQPQSWNNPASGRSGTIIPFRQYANAAGQPCREYSQDVYMDGHHYDGHGAACRGSDGIWRIVSK